MSLRTLWVEKGDNPDPAKGRKYALNRPYFDLRDDSLSKDKLIRWRDTPPFDSIGVYACSAPDWDRRFTTDPEFFAEWIHQRLNQIAAGTGMRLPCVHVNIEKGWVASYPSDTGSPLASYVTDFSHAWRQRRATRVTSLILDGMQGGWWDGRPLDIAAVNAAMYEEVQVEIYGAARRNPDNGQTLYDPLDEITCVDDLRNRGFQRVVPMHDGQRLLNELGIVLGHFYGGVFTQGRLL